MNTWHIHIKGQIQGIGFRPFIYRLAKQENLNGWVCNSIDGVRIEFNGTRNAANDFLEKITGQSPVLSKITWHQLQEVEKQKFEGFNIVESSNTGVPNLLLTPDFGLCEDCRIELSDSGNRRYNYPFTTCTNCGPRYSIVKSLPYDRPFTSMSIFKMCALCSEEYHQVENRRYFSQTNSCSSCGISLKMINNNKDTILTNKSDILQKTLDYWEAGKIIAIKGIGGYLLTCNARNEDTIKKLRRLKHRPTKPLALMFPNETLLTNEFDCTKKEIDCLKSEMAPILIVEFKQKTTQPTPINNSYMTSIAPNLNQLGVMLPYTPLFDLLLNRFGKPIIATSGNISNSPIVFKEEQAIDELTSIADFILTNNQEIVVPQDDSVIRFSFFKKQKIILRRSRGLAPNYINAQLTLPPKTIFAAGAMLKSTFTFLHQGNTFISQYLGDLENFDTQENYRHTVQHFFNLFKSQPELVLCDAHPDYTSSQFAAQLSYESQLTIFKIQHHLAHFSALLGERNLIHSKTSILGVIWDGTGLGDDGQIWGGEFFIYDQYQFERHAHLEYFDFILGNKMPKEPRISALSISKNSPEAKMFLKEKFSEEEWKIYTKILTKESALKTSSMGRLFDAVASVLAVCDKQSFEGEGAIILENLALSYFKKKGLDFKEIYFSNTFSNSVISYQNLLLEIIKDRQDGKAKEFIAAKFHYSLVHIIQVLAETVNIKEIAFSGGVFQNSLLVDLLIHHLGKDYKLYFHQELSPNDENISFGQLIYYHIQQFSASK